METDQYEWSTKSYADAVRTLRSDTLGIRL